MRDTISVNEVQNFNATGLCSEKTCDKPYTHYVTHVIHGVILLTPLCEKHANIISQKELTAIIPEV